MDISVQPRSFDHLFQFPLGDLTILARYKGYDVVGKVITSAMMLASPIWGELLQNHPVQELTFTNDNGEALLILLRIAHLRFGAIKPTYEPPELFEIAILCEKYNCASLVKPWLGSWLPLESWATILNDDRWLYIAWAFGREIMFRKVAKGIVTRMRLSPSFVPFTQSRVAFPRPYPNCNIMENILTARASLIHQITALPYADTQRFTEAHRERRVVCRARDPHCDKYVLDGMVAILVRYSLWPPQRPEEIFTSVDALAWNISQIKIDPYNQAPYSILGPHSSCGISGYSHQVLNILRNFPEPVDMSQIARLQGKDAAGFAEEDDQPLEEPRTESLMPPTRVSNIPGPVVESQNTLLQEKDAAGFVEEVNEPSEQPQTGSLMPPAGVSVEGIEDEL
ncbi:uncharacterized protein L3040_005062 [Drepanopeziza brunnea f. sp. 'multigermtubi']|uniref:Nuclear pore protein n=1 Tax=Marssonina brunnea f. sp. multigermtubi (strain MB_m1) TaxID=1072389 RepID=K1XXC9_MARBU|nr:uncharacterized protein MBM_04320 [Drepanopeziza brunnea f. sp. 'multigermtubi' MB_m1]EKD17459.1 hypothetical protein MBM_04320 [Drepanopeziza brunnea f. sp. 'multigermtubi' MB_m1]KAJ5042519.1 hypothetical protein L3040_005062 [Drepanopeziza brunnea f. sp. 'multigermtubi']